MQRVFHNEVGQPQLQLDGRFALRIINRASFPVQRNGSELVRGQRGREERTKRVLVEVHCIEVDFAGLFRRVELARDVETAARFRALPHRQREAAKPGELVFDPDIEIECGLVILKLIVAVAPGEIAQHEVARCGGLQAFPQGERGQFDRPRGGAELGQGGYFHQAGHGPFESDLGAQVAALDRIICGTVGREQRLARLAKGQPIFINGDIFEIDELTGELELNIGAVHCVGTEPGAQILNLRRQIRLQLFSVLLRQHVQLRVDLSAHRQAAQQELPVEEIQFVQGQSERGFLETRLALAPAQVHRLVQRGPEQLVRALFAAQIELLHQRTLVRQVDRHLVFEVQIERGGGLGSLPDAELAAGKFSIGGNDRGFL